MGHMYKVKQGIKSTKSTPTGAITNSDKNNPPPLKQTSSHDLRIHTIRTNTLETAVSHNQLKELLATNLPGQYPVTSARGHKYLFVMYDYDANYIHATPIKSQKSEEIVRGFAESYAVLTKDGFRAKSIRLDNKISKDFKDRLQSISTYHTNWFPRVTTEQIWQNVPLRLSKTISLPCSAALTQTSQPTVGIY